MMTSSDARAEATGLAGVLVPALIGLTALNFFIYGPSLTFGFLVNSDDQAYIFRNPYLLDLSFDNLYAIFTNTLFFSYVPITLASYSLDYTIWKFHPFGFHLTQLALANSFLALTALLLARVPLKVALGAAFIYSAHPIHVESVVWIASRKNLLSSFFIFLSLICYIRYVQRPVPSWRNYVASLCLFILALLSKPVAVALPLAFILYDLCVANRGWRLAEKIPFFAGAALFAGATLLIPGKAHRIVGYVDDSFLMTALHMFRAYWDYISSLALPFSLSPQYYYTQSNLWEWQSLLSYILIPLSVVVAIKCYRTKPLLAFFVGWFFLWLLPVSNIVPLPTFRQDRYLYLSSLVIAVFFANTLLSCRPITAKYGLVALSVAVILLSGLTNRYANVFSSDRALWTHVAEIYPKWSGAQYESGYRCWMANDLDCAAHYYRRALDANPKNVQALANMGALLIDQGDYPRARIFLERALDANPNVAIIYHNLAVIAMETGENKDKISQWLRKSEELRAREEKKDYNLGPFRYQ